METIQLGEISVSHTRKSVKHVYLSVHPPNGRVTLVTPYKTRSEVARAYVISKLDWIRDQQEKMRAQARETPRQFIERESHYLWGNRYLLTIHEENIKPSIRLGHSTIELTVRPDCTQDKRRDLIYEWQKSLIKDAARELITLWEPRLGVEVTNFYLQRMKTKWGSCNHSCGTIRLNTELVKKPKNLLEYVVVHEMLHLLEPVHNQSFIELMDTHYPSWSNARSELNELPLASASWT